MTEDMETEIEDLKSQLEGRDNEFKVRILNIIDKKVSSQNKLYYQGCCILPSNAAIYFQNLMHKLRLTEKSSRQHLTNEMNRNAQMKKRLEEAERKIERLNGVIQVTK